MVSPARRTLGSFSAAARAVRAVSDAGFGQVTIVADRAKGYSLVDREAEPGFRSISVPVRRYDGVIVAAINMGAHVDRVSSP